MGPVSRVVGAVSALAVAAGVVLCLLALVTVAPSALGLSQTVPLAQVVSVRGVLALGWAACALAVLVLRQVWLLLRRRQRSASGVDGAGRGDVRARASALVAAVLAAVALVHAGVLGERGVAQGSTARSATPGGSGRLVVLQLNTEAGGATPRQIATAATAAGADVLSLPETSRSAAEQVAALMPEEYAVVSQQTRADPTSATSLLVAASVGAYAPAPAPRLLQGTVSAAPASRDAGSLPPLLAAVHTAAPLPVQMGRWRSDVADAAAVCRTTRGAVVAGDFNATLDHAGLRDLGPCVDAARAVGAAGLGTWPSRLPPLLSAPIDHVLVDARVWRVRSARLVTVGNTDHRGVVVVLDRREASTAGG
jgi:endonuclease/exonuclease/phosphatase (EEP) superfamily protein YafD